MSVDSAGGRETQRRRSDAIRRPTCSSVVCSCWRRWHARATGPGSASPRSRLRPASTKSTTSRLLAQLRDTGYVRQDGYRRYRLTAKLGELGAGFSEVEDLRVVARRHLEVMHERFDEEIQSVCIALQGPLRVM